MPTRRWGTALASLLALGAACGGGAGAPTLPSAPEARPPAAPKARWLLVDHRFVERGEGETDHVLAGGQRLAVEGFAVVGSARAEPEVDGGARAPSWSTAGAPRYLFWKGRKLFEASSFLGELREIGALPADPRGTFAWTTGTGLAFAGGLLVVPATGGAPQPLGVPVGSEAIAADAQRGVVLTAPGRAFATTDGGKTFRALDGGAGSMRGLVVRGGAIVSEPRGGRARVVLPAPSGPHAADAGSASMGPRPEEPDRFVGGSASRALEAAVRGVPTDDGGVIVAEDGFVGRLDLATLRTTSLASLEAGPQYATCMAFRAPDAPLLLCAGERYAAVIDVSGAPRLERTFDLTGAVARARFAGTDREALGFLGRCSATEGAPEPPSGSRSLSDAICVRAGRDTWIEHRLDPTEAADLLAWIPRPSGGAAALLASPGATLEPHRRVSLRGALRVVRLPQSEPPWSLAQTGYTPESLLDRGLRIGADDAVEGFLATGGGNTGVTAVSIDAAGFGRAYPAPLRAGTIAHAGARALTRSEDGRLWETQDRGRTWFEIEPPPGRDTTPSACSPAGCRVGAFVRLGWSDLGEGAPRVAPRPAVEPERARGRRPPPPPVVRVACSFEGPPESKRIADSEGLGYTPAPVPRGGGVLRLGTLGGGIMPPTALRATPTGNLDLTWVAPLDTDARVRRASTPLSLVEGPRTGRWTWEMRLGWLLGKSGLEAFAIEQSGSCTERLLARAGVVRSLGGCLEEGTIAADVGARTFAMRVDYASIRVWSADVAPARAAARPTPATPLALLARSNLEVPLRGFGFALGARAGAPVLVAVDLAGDAALVPIDPARGTLGASEDLRSLRDARAGSDAACRPRGDDARVVLPLEGQIGFDGELLRGLTRVAGAGVAILRWSRDRVCLDALEIPVRDERFEDGGGTWERPGAVRKIIARWDGGAPRATLFSMSAGAEVRQRLSCK